MTGYLGLIHPCLVKAISRRGILAILLRGFNLFCKWNLRDWNPTQIVLHRSFTLSERGAALFPPGPSIHLSRWSGAKAV
jgi:hypothetical protein